MITYQIRPRTFRIGDRPPPTFPAEVVLRVLLGPPQPFGGDGYGRAVVEKGKVLLTFDANTGQQLVQSDPRLEPLDVRLADAERNFHLAGQELEIRSQFGSLALLDEFLQSLVLLLPWLLNVEFADPPYVERVNGEIGGVPFVWELKQWKAHFAITTTELQEHKFADSVLRSSLVTVPHRRRLLAALHYFHRACRLDRAAVTAGEFLAEALLNYAKVLEVLFPGAQSVDAARAGLRGLGYSNDEIERDFAPALLLRNQIDVAHVYLGIFKTEQLAVLHWYAESSEGRFRELMKRVLQAVEKGEWEVPAYEVGQPREAVAAIVDRLAERQGSAARRVTGNDSTGGAPSN